MEKNNLIESFMKLGKKTKLITLLSVGIVLIAAIVSIVVLAPSGKTNYLIKTSLKEVFESSELSTSEYTYNSIVKVPVNPEKPLEGNNIKYQVAYKGTVKSGFDFKKINFDEKDDALIVIIPKIEIHSVTVDTDMEYIFTKEKYNTEKTYAEAFNACNKDLEEKAKTNKTLYATAIDSAVELVKALTKPFEKQLEDGKSIQIVYVDNYISEAK